MFGESFWVAVAFVLLVALVFRPLKNAIFNMLDRNTLEATKMLEEATNVKEEARHRLEEMSKKLEAMKITANNIIEQAETEAKAMASMQKDAQLICDKKIELTKAGIASKEDIILKEVTAHVVNKAVESLQENLLKELDREMQMNILENGLLNKVKKVIH